MNFEELDYQRTALGELILRQRQVLALDGREIFEVKLNDEYLMSLLFHESEVALTDLGLVELTGEGWDVVVGGLGLGYTAAAALKYDQVARMIVVEALAPVIEWHQRELVPNGKLLAEDARCRYYHEDFFALARGDGFDPEDVYKVKPNRARALISDRQSKIGHRLKSDTLYMSRRMDKMKIYIVGG